jgi:hypothetical protein
MNEADTSALVFHEVFRLPPSNAGDSFNFINESLLFLSRWCATYCDTIPHGVPAYTCLVGCERVFTDSTAQQGCQERLHFRDDTPADLLGRIYLCSYTFEKVFAQSVPCASLHDCESMLIKAGLNENPVVFFNAAERRVLWRLTSSDELHQAILRAPSCSELTCINFDNILVDFHHDYTETPQGYSRPWINASLRITKERLEDDIRDDLFLFLRHSATEPMSVLREYYNPDGRTDLLIYFRDEQQIYYVELKVLREWVKSGKGRKHIPVDDQISWGKKGIIQAYLYRRSSKDQGKGYTCCFDAREINQELPELISFAQEKEVNYRRYYMHSSTESLHASLIKT